jgi:signal transduction histidine kinase
MASFGISDVALMLRREVDTIRAVVAHKQVKVDMIIADDVSAVVQDGEKLRQIAFYVLSSAATATHRGRIALILGREASCLKVTVTDTGRGIEEPDLDRLFRRPGVCAFHVHDDVSRRLPDRLPDLVIARKLLDLLGGSMVVSSKPGEGTIIEIFVPFRLNRDKEIMAVPLEMNVVSS